MSDVLTVEEVAAELRMTPDAVRRMIRQGRIAGVKVGKRLLVTRAEVERIKAEGTRPVKTEPTEGTQPVTLAGGRSFPRGETKGGEGQAA